MIDFVQLLKQLTLLLKENGKIKLNRELYLSIKEHFLNECKNLHSRTEQYSHSLTYFLFLSTKLGFFEENLLLFTVRELYESKVRMEIESVIILLFTFSRIEKALGEKTIVALLEDKYHQFTKQLIRENLFRQRNDLGEFISTDPCYSAKIGKLVMVIKGLTFNKKILQENFFPYIKECITMSFKVMNTVLNEVPPDSPESNLITLANLLSSLCFDMHPSNANDKTQREFLRFDQEVYVTIIENLFVQLSTPSRMQDAYEMKNDLIVLLYAMKSYMYYEQARV